MVWNFLKSRFAGASQSEEPELGSRDVFRTLSALSGEGVPVPTFIKPTDYSSRVGVMTESVDADSSIESYGRNVAKAQALRSGIINLGWIWLAGTTEYRGEETVFCHPAAFAPVGSDKDKAVFTGDAQVSPLVSRPAERFDLLSRLSSELGFGLGEVKWGAYGLILQWAKDFGEAIGIEVKELRHGTPAKRAEEPGITAHLGVGLFATHTATRGNRTYDLSELKSVPSLSGTAFDALYGDDSVNSQQPKSELYSFRPLSQRQRMVARNKLSAPLAVLSGAPGTGKTHLISVTAADAISRGQSVLVVAGSPNAVDVLVDHFARTPGPPPVAFGGSRYGAQVSAELSALADLADQTRTTDGDLRADVDLYQEPMRRVRSSLQALSTERVSPDASSYLNFSIDSDLDELVANESEAARVAGELLVQNWVNRLERSDKNTLRRVADALLLSRFERRRTLSRIESESLVRAAPLWVGSLDDVDDVLPSTVGLFDLVIIDEASQVDQIAAANALIRAKRALICGDPEQINFEPYLATESIETAKMRYGTTDKLFDPQTQSLFDAGAAKVPVEVLDEHFRSVPHLIEFSSRRFYDGGLHTATRHPSNEAADHVDVTIVDGKRATNGVNGAEVVEVMSVLDSHLGQWASIGLISPFEEQAHALEFEVRARFTLEEMLDFGLRVGTVRAFQGDECDLMVVSLGVGRGEPASAWDQVNDPQFFNVMATRAREHVHIISSNPAPPGLAGEYLLWEKPLVDLVVDEGSTDPWTLKVAGVLEQAGVPVRLGYRVGRYVVDLVAGEGEHAVAIDCTLHPDGVDAHIDRGLMLRRTGWQTADAFEEKWQYLLDDYPTELREKFQGL